MNTTSAALKKPRIAFWILWPLVTAFAWAIFLAVNITAIDTRFYEFPVLWLFGILQGLLQWLVLRPYIRRAGWWLLINAAPAIFLTLFLQVGGNWATSLWIWFFSTTLGEWVLLSRTIRMTFLWWIAKLLAVVITALVSILPLLLVFYSGAGDPTYWGGYGLLAGGTLGLITGICLGLLLRIFPRQFPMLSVRYRWFQWITLAVTTLVVLILPFSTFGQIFTMQSQIYCQTLKVGSSMEEVKQQIRAFRTFETYRLVFSEGQEKVSYPPQLKQYGKQISEFMEVELADPILQTPRIGLAFDAQEKLVAFVSLPRYGFQNYQSPQCPWTVKSTWDTLFLK